MYNANTLIFDSGFGNVLCKSLFLCVSVMLVEVQADATRTYARGTSSLKSIRIMARVAPALPPSLSPHICIVSSPDLADLLSASSLPPLPQILQSFSPLPQGKTYLLQSVNPADPLVLL